MTKKTNKEQIDAIARILGAPEKVPFYRFNFGMYNGKTLEAVLKDRNGKDYLLWLYNESERINPILEKYIEKNLVNEKS